MSTSNVQNTSDGPKTYIERYLKRGFGSMTKNDFEVFIFSELLSGEYANYSNYQISCKLKIPESKVKRLRYEANLQYADHIEERSKKAFLKAIDRVKLRKDGQRLAFVIEDLSVRKYLEHKLKSMGSFADFSFNSEVIVVNVTDFIMLIEENFGFDEKEKLKQQLKEDNKKSFVEVMKPVVTSMFGKAGEEAVSFTFDAIMNVVQGYMNNK